MNKEPPRKIIKIFDSKELEWVFIKWMTEHNSIIVQYPEQNSPEVTCVIERLKNFGAITTESIVDLAVKNGDSSEVHKQVILRKIPALEKS